MSNADLLRTISPEDPFHEGCPVRVKTRNVVIDAGVPAIVEWSMRDAKGQTRNLSGVLPEPALPEGVSVSESIDVGGFGSVKVRILVVDVPGIGGMAEVPAVCTSPSTATVQFKLPPVVTQKTGIYRLSIGVLDHQRQLACLENGLLFVEPGLWGDVNLANGGPPSLKELRAYLRDTRTENDFLKDVEFSDEELIMAIVGPVRTWNELLPPVAPFTCQTFPFRELWIKGCIGQLCRTAALWYQRNKMQTTHAGISTDDRNKNAEYQRIGDQYTEEFLKFARAQKVRINISRAYSTLNGPYY
jgi:hypothetical protein